MVTLQCLTVKGHGLLSVGAFLGRSPPFFTILLFLVRLTPAMPNLVEFMGKREGESVIERSRARGNHS